MILLHYQVLSQPLQSLYTEVLPFYAVLFRSQSHQTQLSTGQISYLQRLNDYSQMHENRPPPSHQNNLIFYHAGHQRHTSTPDITSTILSDDDITEF